MIKIKSTNNCLSNIYTKTVICKFVNLNDILIRINEKIIFFSLHIEK
jgi:hypothetical protein